MAVRHQLEALLQSDIPRQIPSKADRDYPLLRGAPSVKRWTLRKR